MISKKIIFLLLTTMVCAHLYSQNDLSNYTDIESVYIISHWGNVNAVGTNSKGSTKFTVEARFTDSSKKTKIIDDYTRYMSFEVKEKKLYIKTRKPEGFESIDLYLKIPEDLLLEILLQKGGEIVVSNFNKGVEINSLNGSVKLEGIGEYALVNATNGEIKASFDKINQDLPISLVTLNGGITVEIPENAKHDLRLISRKNGYIESDFIIDTRKPILHLNQKIYSKQAIDNKGSINGGGSLLFLSTENGPIAIKRVNL